MILESVLAYLHIAALLAMVVFISSEAALCRAEWLNAAVVERLVRVDLLYLVATAGVALTGFAALPLVILGVAVLTFAFFGAHSTASSWVGRRSPGMRAEASSLFLFFYYLGGSIVGTLSGFAWGHFGWSGVVALLEGLLGLALAVAIGLAFLKPLPGNEPGAQKSGS